MIQMSPFFSPLSFRQSVVHRFLTVASVTAWNVSKNMRNAVVCVNECERRAAVCCTCQPRPLLQLQDPLRLSVQVRCADVIQRVVLQRGRSRVDVGGELQRVGGAVSGGGAYGADSLGRRLQGGGRTLVKSILFTSGVNHEKYIRNKTLITLLDNDNTNQGIFWSTLH